jgi:hypothetical protein
MRPGMTKPKSRTAMILDAREARPSPTELVGALDALATAVLVLRREFAAMDAADSMHVEEIERLWDEIESLGGNPGRRPAWTDPGRPTRLDRRRDRAVDDTAGRKER